MKIVAKTEMSAPFPPDVDGKEQWAPGRVVLLNGLPYRVGYAEMEGKPGEGFTEIQLTPIPFIAILDPGEQLEYVTEWAEVPDA
ncbi:hypothetical protein AUR04nite_00290 [Glutamicibacter uratoxydans]|uniref:Uncharacterized protein n=1 Tax=Glutamicibacter uratoxydans TaxID=43667 RepID=A0A4Y4DIP6_GLUUR|nr:hypothetical protein [Glutamicibacter uratoxydans]GED04497.1 hypothetical protein AUR04nite_00290 [Glutamicibacter uratoxydans]